MSTTPAQFAANQANSQKSTGPKTEEGKATSSHNNFRHGLSGAFVVQCWENAEQYTDLLAGLREEHRPANPTEALLVEQMAQHWWLVQRALRLQELTFHSDGPVCTSEKELALYLRYQTTHQRAFSKSLTDLTKLRVDQLKAAERLERLAMAQRAQEASLKRQAIAEVRKTELHAARLDSLDAKAELDRAKAAAKTGPCPIPTTSSYEDRVREMMALDAEREAELQACLKAQAPSQAA
jgi:hypothetical protein